MKVLITGGTGYLGSKVTRRFVEEGHDVVCTRRIQSDMARLEKIEDKVKFISAEISEIGKIMNECPFDLVINTVCNYGRGAHSFDDLLHANVVFPAEILELSAKRGVRRFFSMGTGLPDSFNEYSFSKKILREYGEFYSQKYGINYVNFDLEMFYGADEPEDRFLSLVIHKMLRGESVDTTLGTQRRDIISIEDVVEAIDIVSKTDLVGAVTIPVGTGDAPRISDIVDFIWNETGRIAKVNKGSVLMRKFEPDCVADTSIMESICRWNPKDWKSGVGDMIARIKETCYCGRIKECEF